MTCDWLLDAGAPVGANPAAPEDASPSALDVAYSLPAIDASVTLLPGRLRVALVLPPGDTVSRVLYAVTGPTNLTGSIPLDSSAGGSPEWVIGGLAPGPGYSIVFAGVDTAGDACTGRATGVTIVPNVDTFVRAPLLCATPGH
jgi:hypothetical protein